MNTVQEIERAIERLSEKEVAEIRAWLWDRDIQRYAAAGAFDAIAEDALREHRAGKIRTALEEAEADIRDGRVAAHDDVKVHLAKWTD